MAYMDHSYTRIRTVCGSVQGFLLPTESGSVEAFYGIPYAEPPVGELRWRDARSKTPWDGVLDCTLPLTSQKSAYQWGSDLLAYFRTLNVSEDCLYVNVTTPKADPARRYPVIVWFHGGGLFGGSGSEEIYNLPHLPEQGCVLVTVSTRLGAFGMLSADILGSKEHAPHAGNFIISDMVMALRWVRDNIQCFGGDPDRVILAGESGGSQKVNALMAVPAARNLFQRAIMQSGTSGALPFPKARAAGNLLFEKLGVRTAEEAREVSPERIVEAYNELKLMSDFVIDHYYLSAAPVDAIASGRYNPCDVIMGVNAGEISNLLQLIGGIANYIPVLDRLKRDGCKAFVYELDQIPATWRPLGFRCVHSLDIAYLFGEYENTEHFYDGGPWEQQFMFCSAGKRLDAASFISPVMDGADRLLSRHIMTLWLSFARCGLPVSDGIAWEQWDPNKQNYLYLSAAKDHKPYMKNGFGLLT